MATQAHCAYCFEVISAKFDRREPLSLIQVEDSWEQYHAISDTAVGGESEVVEAHQSDVQNSTSKPAAISRLLDRVRGDNGSDPSSVASSSSNSSKTSLQGSDSGRATPASSVSSRSRATEAHPLFVTWNTVSRKGHKSLRGCIGTFEAQELGHGLREYALISAFNDTRFSPIPQSLLPSLSAHVTLLTNFTSPTRNAYAWTLGQHGLRISFTYHGRRLGATYLPDVAAEQGWTQEETLISLMRKAGWSGSSWEKTWKDGKGELVTYEGKQVALEYEEWRAWKDWVSENGLS